MTQSNPTALETARNGAPRQNTPIYRPRVDIHENEKELVLVIDLPGADRDSIDARCEDGTLTVTARVQPREAPGRRYLWREYGVGDFRRSFQLDERIDSGRISGEYADGVLTLRLPKVEAVQPKRIEIRGA